VHHTIDHSPLQASVIKVCKGADVRPVLPHWFERRQTSFQVGRLRHWGARKGHGPLVPPVIGLPQRLLRSQNQDEKKKSDIMPRKLQKAPWTPLPTLDELGFKF
jgi:hypothetical protein